MLIKNVKLRDRKRTSVCDSIGDNISAAALAPRINTKCMPTSNDNAAQRRKKINNAKRTAQSIGVGDNDINDGDNTIRSSKLDDSARKGGGMSCLIRELNVTFPNKDEMKGPTISHKFSETLNRV